MKTFKYTMLELIVTVIILVSIIIGVLAVGAVVIGGCWIGSAIHDKGLKPTVERVWEGPKEGDRQLPADSKATTSTDGF